MRYNKVTQNRIRVVFSPLHPVRMIFIYCGVCYKGKLVISAHY